MPEFVGGSICRGGVPFGVILVIAYAIGHHVGRVKGRLDAAGEETQQD
jgi:hypothetical protein